MSGLDDLMAESNDRWVKAAKRARGVEDKGLGEAVKTYYAVYLPVGLAALLLVATFGGVLISGRAPGDWSSFWLFGWVFAFLGAVIGGLIYNAKKVVPAADVGRVAVVFSLEKLEQKHVRRQILGKAAVEPEHLAVTRGAAVQMRKNLATQLIFAPLWGINFLVQGFLTSSPGSWLTATGFAVLAIAGGFGVRDFRRAGRFLARTAGQTGG